MVADAVSRLPTPSPSVSPPPYLTLPHPTLSTHHLPALPPLTKNCFLPSEITPHPGVMSMYAASVRRDSEKKNIDAKEKKNCKTRGLARRLLLCEIPPGLFLTQWDYNSK